MQLASFIGREREIDEVRALVRAQRLVTLTDAAGCGKTRLALQVGAEVLDEFADGVWLAELAPVADPELLAQAVAAAVGIRETPATAGLAAAGQMTAPEPARPLRELLLEHLRERRLLLVLDNCEHLARACAALADPLLRACPDLRVLATSREPMGIGGEITWRVPSLSAPDPGDLPPLEGLLEYEAVRLFADRARARRPDFELDEAQGAAVAQICRRLDGIALAIELAAARVSVLPPAEIAARLDDRFRLLTGGARTALERHQTLRAAVDWSYNSLSESEQILLGRLLAFVGGFTLEAAEAICSGTVIEAEGVLDLLARLVDKSLVVTDDQRARYGLLETIRQYAREKLADSEGGVDLRDRHRDWYPPWSDAPTASFGDRRRPAGRACSTPSTTTCAKRWNGHSARAWPRPRCASWARCSASGSRTI